MSLVSFGIQKSSSVSISWSDSSTDKSSERSPAFMSLMAHSAVKASAACCFVRAHDECHSLPSYVTLLPIQGPVCMLLGAVKPMQFTASCLSVVCPETKTTLGSSSEMRSQCRMTCWLLTSPSPSLTASLKDCQFYSAWLYLFTASCTIISNWK